jgi:hypothetical protein
MACLWPVGCVTSMALRVNSSKSILFGVNNLDQHKMAFWSIYTPISAHAVPDTMPFAADCTARAANMRIRAQ